MPVKGASSASGETNSSSVDDVVEVDSSGADSDDVTSSAMGRETLSSDASPSQAVRLVAASITATAAVKKRPKNDPGFMILL